MKKFFQEFKQFISRGNILDMAVGVIIGGAFSKIVTSLVNDIIMPLIAWACGGKSMADLSIVLNGQSRFLPDGTLNPAALLWNYGNFIQTIIDFLIVALCIFLMLKLVMTIRKKMTEAKESVEKLVKKPEEQAEAEATLAEAVVADATEEVKEEPVQEVIEEEKIDNSAEIVALLKDIKEALNK